MQPTAPSTQVDHKTWRNCTELEVSSPLNVFHTVRKLHGDERTQKYHGEIRSLHESPLLAEKLWQLVVTGGESVSLSGVTLEKLFKHQWIVFYSHAQRATLIVHNVSEKRRSRKRRRKSHEVVGNRVSGP